MSLAHVQSAKAMTAVSSASAGGLIGGLGDGEGAVGRRHAPRSALGSGEGSTSTVACGLESVVTVVVKWFLLGVWGIEGSSRKPGHVRRQRRTECESLELDSSYQKLVGMRNRPGTWGVGSFIWSLGRCGRLWTSVRTAC